MQKLAKRKDGRYRIGVYIGRDSNGKSKYKYVYGKTQKEVKEKANKVKIRVGKGLDLLNDKMTFGELTNQWIIYKTPLLRKQQLNDYKTALKPFSPLNDRKLNTLIKNDFQAIISEYAVYNPHTGKPTAKATLNSYKMAARQVIDYAIENRILEYNPLQYVVIPKTAPKQKRRELSEIEQQWIINTEHRAQLPAMIMMLAGLRLGECLALQWQDIDLKKSCISVHQKLLYKENPPAIVQGAKSENGIRQVNIPKLLVEYLKAHSDHNPSDYVCLTAHGKLYTAEAWKRVWGSYLKTLNIKYGDFSKYEKKYKSKFDPDGVPFVIERFTAHYLRHTHATNLFRCGRDILYIRDQLGHADPETTLKIYTHLVKNHQISKTNKVISIDKYFEKISTQKAN